MSFRTLLVFAALITLCWADGEPNGYITTLMNSIPACVAVNARGYRIKNCDAVSQCYKTSHEKAGECVKQEHGNPKHKECADKPDLKALLTKWFELSCQWHTAVDQCMEGGVEPNAEFAPFLQQDSPNLHNHQHSSGGGQSHHGQGAQGHGHHQGPSCWRSIHEATRNCTDLGRQQCTNFKYCVGHDMAPDDGTPLLKWHKIVLVIKKQMLENMRSYAEKMKTCKAAE